MVDQSEDHTLSPVDISEQERFEERYYEIKAVLTRWCDQLKPQAASNTSGIPSAESPSTLERVLEQQAELLRHVSVQHSDEHKTSANVKSHVKLPVIKLFTFDDKIEEWKQFSDSFKSMIVQKFQYLVSALSGSVAKAVEAFEISEQNYDAAWNHLTERFDNDKILRRRHIQCLIEMPRVDKESAAAIQTLVDHTQKYLRILKSMNLPTEAWDDLCCHVVHDGR